jgi:hypothetical protein
MRRGTTVNPAAIAWGLGRIRCREEQRNALGYDG